MLDAQLFHSNNKPASGADETRADDVRHVQLVESIHIVGYDSDDLVFVILLASCVY